MTTPTAADLKQPILSAIVESLGDSEIGDYAEQAADLLAAEVAEAAEAVAIGAMTMEDAESLKHVAFFQARSTLLLIRDVDLDKAQLAVEAAQRAAWAIIGKAVGKVL